MKIKTCYLTSPPLFVIVALLFGTAFISSCSLKNYTRRINYSFQSLNGLPDYSNLDYWAAHPWKMDPSDNVPSSLIELKNDSLADVFFIYPTTYLNPEMKLGWNAPIDDQKTNQRTDNTTILYQASVFNQHCRVFSPRYRQANLNAFYTDDIRASEEAFRIAYDDIKTAFEYYLLHFNHGRAIIIASHSQGTRHAGQLLKDFFENKPLKNKLVCAYIIGLPVFNNYFSSLKPCADSLSTGCFVSWRSFRKFVEPEFVKKEKIQAYVTNPLTWKLDDKFAPDKLNKGGILKNFNKIKPGLVSAEVHGNILWVSRPKFFGNIFLTAKNYHIVDYNLFYMNIRQNVYTRIRSYLALDDLIKKGGNQR